MQYIRTPHEAELNAALVMKSWGFSDATATTGGADGGIDVRSKAALAQVKWKNGAAGRPDLQRLYGARGNDTHKQLFFFVSSDYTKQAIEYADAADVKLFIFDPLGAMKPANKRAESFLRELADIKVPARPPLLRMRWFRLLLVATSILVAVAVIAALIDALIPR